MAAQLNKVDLESPKSQITATTPGVLKRNFSYQLIPKGNKELTDHTVQSTKSEGFRQNVRILTPLSEKMPKKVHFLDQFNLQNPCDPIRTTNNHASSLNNAEEKMLRILGMDEMKLDSNIESSGFKPLSTLNLEETRNDEKSDNLLSMLSIVPPDITDGHGTLFNNDSNLVFMMTPAELIYVSVLIVFFVFSFFTFILRQSRFDLFGWLLSKVNQQSEFTSYDILMVIGKNIKRMCKNLFSLN